MKRELETRRPIYITKRERQAENYITKKCKDAEK
jgi:hypothetical protein